MTGTVPNDLRLLDFLAAHASEEDIQSVKHLIKERQITLKNPTTGYTMTWSLPKHWRQLARYLHADLMMDARRERK
jgi:hypothetical protein